MTTSQSQASSLVGFRKLIVYQKAKSLVLLIYQSARRFPSFEKFGLTSQLQRAAVSVLLNIVEGHARGSRKDYAHFINIAHLALVPKLKFYLNFVMSWGILPIEITQNWSH